MYAQCFYLRTTSTKGRTQTRTDDDGCGAALVKARAEKEGRVLSAAPTYSEDEDAGRKEGRKEGRSERRSGGRETDWLAACLPSKEAGFEAWARSASSHQRSVVRLPLGPPCSC